MSEKEINTLKHIRFVDSHYNVLFKILDGESIIITDIWDNKRWQEPKYIDEHHMEINGRVFHICQYAQIRESRGEIYFPTNPIYAKHYAYYDLYQIHDKMNVPYKFRSFAEAESTIKQSHYSKVYSGMFSINTDLNDLFRRHNANNRPFSDRIRSMSMSDVVVLHQGETSRAFYVDDLGFAEIAEEKWKDIRSVSNNKLKSKCQNKLPDKKTKDYIR